MSHDELTLLAKLYYIDGLTQEDLASRFCVSRAKVGRMLKHAEKEGIVEIRVHHHPQATQALEQELRERFGIRNAIIAVDHADPDKQRQLLAGLVASHLDRILTEGSIVAVGVGRNVSEVSHRAVSSTRRGCSFICAIGGSYRGGEAMNADHICRRLASRFGGDSETLYAPALVDDPTTRENLMANETVRRSLANAQRAEIALIGIGDLVNDSNIDHLGWFSPEEMAAAKAAGAVGDVMGYNFIDIHGKATAQMPARRAIGLTLEHLRVIPNVIAVASEPTKVTGMLGALRSGVIDTLATTQAVAQTLLSLAGAPAPEPMHTQKS